MVAVEEKDFPRGGRKLNSAIKKRKRDDNLFHEKPPKVRRLKNKIQREDVTEEIFQSSLHIQGTLSYKKIQDGMVLLCCVRHVTDFSIEVEFPGLTFGRVSVTNISDVYTKHLNKQLEDNVEYDVGLKNIFKPGQFVVVKVLSVETTEKGILVKCTMNPKDINHEKSHNSLKKGMLIWVSVQSVLDHGYEMNLGVDNCRAFLPSKNVDEGRVLSIGEPLWCVIHKSESENSVTTIRVSSKEQHIKTAKIEEIDGLHSLMPGMKVEVVTDKIVSTGIHGKFLNDYLGYIDASQLHISKNLSDYKEGKLISAYVLYVEPVTKITHLTLRNLDSVSLPKYSKGTVVNAEVILKAYNGLYLKLPSNEKCFVANKRLINSLAKESKLDVSKKIYAKFPIGSYHGCRILDYSNMSRVYICTVEQSVVKETIFSAQDIQIGQLVTVTIKDIKSDGMAVTAGHISGFVPNLHISNFKYSDTLKKKYKEGHKAKARVLNIVDDNVIFTLKQSLVESDKCLVEIGQAQIGEQYPCVVIQMKSMGALVIFYGNVKGWLSKNCLDEEIDPQEYFYRGQVILPWVLGVKEESIFLTLRQPFNKKSEKRKYVSVGQRVNGIVSKIYKDRLDIKSLEGKIIGILPVNHLSCTPSLCATLSKTFKTDDRIRNLLCVYSKDNTVILSRREALILNANRSNTLNKLKDIKQGSLLRCSYVSKCKTGIYILPLILDFGENVLVNNKDIVNEGEALPKFTYYQSIVAKVLDINYESKEMHLTIKFSEVFDNRVETAINYFSRYLTDFNYIRTFGLQNGWDICQYQPGERVSCKIEQLGDKGGCLVALPNGVKGLVPPRLCPDKLVLGETVEGVFLSQDFKDNYVEVCLKPSISQKINKVQDGVINTSSMSSCIVETVIIKNDSIIGVLKQDNCRRQFVYIPLYVHENDYKGFREYYEKHKLKVCICGKLGQFLIGMSRKLFLTLDKQKAHSKRGKPLILKNIPKGNENKASSPFSNISSLENVKSDNYDKLGQEESESENVGEIDEITPKVSQEDGSNHVRLKIMPEERKEIKNKVTQNEDICSLTISDSTTGSLPILPGMSSFFNTSKVAETEFSSDEENEDEPVKKKKKLTPIERAELARQEEERISKVEKELADSSSSPKNAEQFDRLLLANPNSSELWIKYMSFHIAATEFNKARSVAKRALESIDITLTEERFNVWVVLLNLESMLGTKESFDKTFEEAIRCNDSLKMYLKAIEILADANKFTEMEEKIKKIRNKHKHEPVMWLEIARTLYSKNKLAEARNIKEAALKSIQDRKTQLNLIVRFAILEFKYGEEEQGAAIFETILSSDPRKVNIWTTYVDQLVNQNRIDQARRVLERSVCQRLPLKSMKTLFLKFRMFEEKHGTEESVEMVKEKAKEYITKAGEK